MQEKLYFYYTNDLHSNFDNWPQVAGFLKGAKEKRLAENQACWLIDIGDHVDRVHPIAEGFMGKANVQLMNDVGYDLVTIGNNEGITMDHDDLHHLYDEADFQVVCANLHSLTDAEPAWLQTTVHIQSNNGVKVGVIGLTAPFNAFYELLNWHISAPIHTLEKHISHLKEAADIIILMSHLGLSEDQEIARRFDDIDVIIGGHTHHLLRTGENVNNTIITAAGKHCAYAGEVVLTWDHMRRKLVDKKAAVYDMTELAKDLNTEQTLHDLTKKAEALLGQSVIQLKKPIHVKWFQHTDIMQKLTDTLREWTEADVAMLNAGILLDQIPAGQVTYREIHRICPHPINPCVVRLDGNELTEVVRASVSKELTELKLKGFGFRGEVLGKMICAGMEVETCFREDGSEYVRAIQYHGEPLDPNRTYKVATADTFTFGRLLPEIAKSEVKHYFVPEFLRDLLAYTLRHKWEDY
ncbi:2',3'-cyclic-nucleotide 2'-phosphodiesterase/5'-or 3'-nucleotidase, 5'-nucleotidase family [Lentibacillus halodurans]|uniref:2',3'-cyclic-nucleotide 2'-phosphodiesterase/5'-or 3'-nucleotidase, 5'-nucleotidase family n=1 Tax=Lentibacillus halodurans TaxID=237679 RepID=A0A1I0WRG1_9BACI|nr:bifunctional UDP-sugar hydrolase/5'-nucleotidase [Lentibacillus halodurans]SFA90778.1 2',3'-cyclic-nucleotide 2'-phosphodiesterase/5'-or 3'-nucleotidase, 5'-nucleotidase family [Lentibacillus halodurans]